MSYNPYPESQVDPVLRQVVAAWLSKIEQARKHKQEVFQDAANECMSFYTGPRSWDDLMGRGSRGLGTSHDMPDPTFKMHVNKAFELVTIFGPSLYYENPVRTVKPRAPFQVPPAFFPDPYTYQALIAEERVRVMTDGLRAVLLQSYLNLTPGEGGLECASRLGIDEALVKGAGTLWTELATSPGNGFRSVVSSWDSVDHLLIDPDAPSLDKAQWIARKCVHPVWQVEKDYGLKPNSLRGNLESQARQADIETDDDGQYDRKRGLTNDLLVYYKIWSKMGIGGRLHGIQPEYEGALEMFGDYCHFAIAANTTFMLNLAPDVTSDPAYISDPSKVFARIQWPTPYWANGGWPVSVLAFHRVFNCPWPMPHLKAGMGELKFLNWACSFLAGHLRNSTRDFLVVKKEAAEEMKTTLLHGHDLELIEIENDHGTIAEVVQFLQHPQINGDIFKVIELFEANFDKRTGLMELLYGGQGATQIRSSAEAQIRSENSGSRIDDMSREVDAWQAEIAAKEAVCARYHLVGQDIQPALGDMAAVTWDQYVVTKDLTEAFHQLEYQIEAGSTRRPNKNFQVEQSTQAVTTLSPLFQTYAQTTGDWSPLNNLLSDFAKAHDLDPNRYQLRAAPLPQALPSSSAAEPEPTTPGLGPGVPSTGDPSLG